ncbi:hypothetical protein NUM3379_21050 [Kineococcus sp. NUM-3379]
MSDVQLWSVTLTLAGEPVDVAGLRASLERLLAERPFLSTVRYSPERAELRYWDEAESLEDAAAMALRLWGEHRPSAGLPDWRLVGMEVVDRGTLEHRLTQVVGDPGRSRRRADGQAQPLSPVGDIAAW